MPSLYDFVASTEGKRLSIDQATLDSQDIATNENNRPSSSLSIPITNEVARS